ncbi:hypothetical protein CH256_08115 [Rhodococcus sp. 05-2254-6]|uniref:hypothetical protein n=1 Tax=Rhodococcus sp. 05-2254-6 TaxID=2022489 RepID=UPI000B9BC0EC|nr:hypothetical protein [Rhodococcus sp. 05-2254-6]OZE38123.1 hypothetical protein CH256_08115 [Rhodococcus sp. 05-2254-6]
MAQQDGTEARGMSKYLEDRPNAQQMTQAQQRETNAEREKPAPVTGIASAHGKELTRLARDPEARKAKYDADRAERDRLDAEREAARIKRARAALEHRTEVANPRARGMSRYLEVDE